jgi:hypothetical protein
MVTEGGHFSFVFPHLCLEKRKVCPPYDNYLLKKKDYLNLCRIYNKVLTPEIPTDYVFIFI